MSQERIGRYGILERIAAGGQATVYRAWDTENAQVVALKVLHSHLGHDAAYIERFRLEARLSVNITHPNVISVFEVAQHGDNHFISMEYLPESLHRVLEVEGRFSVERAVNIAHQICRGLQAAYDAGVEVHRDIKPHNVLLAPDGTMKLTDFGIARAADLSGLTATGAVIGTPHYMSPEQAMGERATARSDIYAIGVTLYQMLSGELPFIGDTPMAVLEKHRRATPRKIRQVRADVPRSLESVIDRCLAKEPNRRYQTPRELAHALQEAVPAAVTPSPRPRAATPPPAAAPPRPPTPPPPPSRPVTPAPQYPSTFMRAWESAVRARRRGPLWARFFALTALLAVVAGVTYVVLQPPTGGSDQLPLGAPVATATPTVGPVASTPTTGRVLREVTLNDGGMIFEDDFELLDLRGWSNPANDVSQIEQFTRFLGRFGNETVTLNLAALPPHDQVELTFDLYLIDSWNGSDSPDFFKVGHSGSTNNRLLHTFSTYCEQERSYTATQPESCGELIGFGRVRPDSIYRNLNNGFVFEHSESTLSISFTGQKPDASDHFWGIDNIRVSIRGVATAEPVRVTGPVAGLPAGAVPFRDHYYLIVNEQMSWLEANAYAESLGGYLVAIGDDAEHQFVGDLAAGQGFVNVFIGLTDEADEGRFVWANGEPLVYTNWNSGEPNNAGGNEDYVNLEQRYGWRWNDVPEFSGPFMVEFEGLPSPIQAPDGLVAWWPGDGNANDIIGGNHGTLQNGATFAPGIVGQAFSFDGVDDFVRIPNSEALDVTDEVTVSLWAKINDLPPEAGPVVLMDKMTSDPIGPFGIGIEGGSTVVGRIYTDSMVGQPRLVFTETPDVQGWHHYAMTYRSGELKAYMDGREVDSSSQTGRLLSTNLPIEIGKGVNRAYNFNGLIDEFQIYDRALEDGEIKAIYDAGSAGLATPVPVAPGPTYGGTLRVGMLAEHNSFDPPSLTGLPDIAAVQHTYDGLVFRDADLSIQPALATAWETTADARLWTFHLREGVKFRHGKELTADDVIFTFNRLFEVGSPLASVTTRPLEITALDDLTVLFFFSEPNAVLLESLVKYHAYITPSDVDPARFATETLGTGPFITTNNEGRGTSFTRNPDYWNEGLPLLDKVTFIYMSNAEELAAELMAGGIDVIYDLNISSVDSLRENPDTVVAQAPSGGYMNLAMDVRQPPFDNVLVRRALQAATDREAILEGAQRGLGRIAYDHPVLPGDPVFNPNCIPPEYDPELARKLLADAGYPDGIDLTLYTSTAGVSMVEMAQVFQERAAAAGIRVDVVVVPEDNYWSEIWLQKPFYTSWWGGRPPHEAFSVVYRSDAVWNESYWSNPDMDALLDLAAREGGLDRQKDFFGALQCLVVEEVPRIIPVFRPVLLGLRNDVRGVEPMWDATLSLHRAWLEDAPGPTPTATATPLPRFTATPLPTNIFTVTSPVDTTDANTGDGICDDGFGRCTLRAAIMEANAFSGADTITLPAGTYTLSRPGAGEDAGVTGDLDITSDLTIQGTGIDTTIIDGGGLDRVIHVVTPNRVNILGLTIQNGDDTSARFGGGGIFNERGFISLVEISVKRNAATDGGGILNLSVLTLTDSIVNANTSRDEGGGIRNGGTLTVISSIVANNAADAQGGGIYDSGTLLVVIGSAVTGNTASAVGGIFTGGAAEITNSTISGNRAARGQGGGIQAYIGATLNITNSTVSNNSAVSGGGIDIIQGTVKITNGTITDNAASEGGGIRIPNTGTLELVNTVIANNPFGGDCSGSGFTSLGNNLDSDGTCNLTELTDLPNTDPLLGPLQDNGGPTETHALLPGSPAIDAGDDASCPDTDQRGVDRPQGAACDIGAYESTATVTATPTPASFPLPPQPQGPRGTLNVIDDLGNEQLLLRAANRVPPLWYVGEPLFWWDWEVDGPTNEAIIESWEFTENAVGSVDWVLNIRPGVKFHKGWGEVTSTDIKFAFTDMLKEGSRNGNRALIGNFYGGNPDNLDDSDPLVLRVRQPEKFNFVQQFRAFSAVTANTLRPYPKAYLDQVGEDEFAQNPIYAGPYEFTSQQLGFDVVLTAVPDHYRVTPGFETIHYFKILDSATKVAALRTGQIDITTLLPSQLKDVEAAGIKIALSKNALEPFVNFGGLYPTNPGYNPNFPWTTNNPLGGSAVEVRKALNYAIDRQAILEKILFGFGEIGIISHGFLSPTAGPGGGPPPWWNDPWQPHPFDPALARQILADAGHAGCFEINMWLVNDQVYSPDIGEAVASMWEKHLGCTVNRRVGEFRPGLRSMLIDQKTDGWTYVYEARPALRPSRYGCLHGGPDYQVIMHSTLSFFTSLCSISDKSLDPVEIANIERQIGDQQYRVFNTAAIASVHIPFGVGPKVKSWVPMPKKFSGLGLLEFAQPA